MSRLLRGVGWRYDARAGEVREFYVDDGGVRRWVIGNEPCPDQILKGNADLEIALQEPERERKP